MHRKIKKEDYPAIEIMIMDRHMRIDRVAEALGVSRQTIWLICRKLGINQYRPIKRECRRCGKEFTASRARIRLGQALYHSTDCYFKHRAEIGDYVDSKQGRRRSRKVIEDWLGYDLPAGCVVHHEDGDQDNLNLSNLWVFPSHAAHMQYHHAKRHGIAALPYHEITDLPEILDEWQR